jgi:hypothetical protein
MHRGTLARSRELTVRALNTLCPLRASELYNCLLSRRTAIGMLPASRWFAMSPAAESILLAHPAEPLELSLALRRSGAEIRRCSNQRSLFAVFDRWLATGTAEVAVMLLHEGLTEPSPVELLRGLRFGGVCCPTFVLSAEQRQLTKEDRRAGIRGTFGRSTPVEDIVRAVADELERARCWHAAWQAIAARDLGRSETGRGRSRSGTVVRGDAVQRTRLARASSTRPPDD